MTTIVGTNMPSKAVVNIKKNLKAWIDALSQQHGSRRQLAMLADVNDDTIGKWFTRKSLPSLENLAAIAEAAGMSLSEAIALLEKPDLGSVEQIKEAPLSLNTVLADVRRRPLEEALEIIYTASASARKQNNHKPKGASVEILAELIQDVLAKTGRPLENLVPGSSISIDSLRQIVYEGVFPCVMQRNEVIDFLQWLAGIATNPNTPTDEHFSGWEELAEYCGIDINNLPRHNSHGSVTNGIN